MPDGSANKKLSYHLISQQLSADANPYARPPYVDVKYEGLFKAGLTISAAAVPVANVFGHEASSRL